MNTNENFLPLHRQLTILLADDDPADRLLFKEAIEELPVSVKLSTVENGEVLMERLNEKGSPLPDVLFLDLNMPKKNGFACLGEIKRNSDLERLPVIIFSTASEETKVTQVFRDAAHYYIRKPKHFADLKNIIYESLVLITQEHNPLPLKENFVLTGDINSTPDEIHPEKTS
jgi:CheY-like chemotaxis protein